MRNSHHLDK